MRYHFVQEDGDLTMVFADGVYFCTDNRQWAVCFNRDGNPENLSVCSWHESKKEAIAAAIRYNRFRRDRVKKIAEHVRYFERLDTLVRNLKYALIAMYNNENELTADLFTPTV